MKIPPNMWTDQQESIIWQSGGTVVGYASPGRRQVRGSRRATPLAPMLDINHIPMEMLVTL